MPLYGTLVPDEPVIIPGKSSALGLWVYGDSSWGRIVYKLRDAKGELWTSIGSRNEWNANDIHSWSFFNFDGWRYVRFPLPSHAPYDSFRELETTWWKSEGGDGVVDLPLRLEKLLVEMRTHVIYVNSVVKLPEPRVIKISGLTAEYLGPEDMSESAILVHNIRMPQPESKPLDNPIARLAQEGLGKPTSIVSVRPPDWFYDGTRAHVNFKEVSGAREYQIWMSLYADGRGGQVVGRPKRSGSLITGLRAGLKINLYVTYTDADGKQSKPSEAFPIELKKEFGYY
jgi:hypothetical protein